MTNYYASPTGGNVPPYNSWSTAATGLQTVVDTGLAGDNIFCNGTFVLDPSSPITTDLHQGSAAAGFISLYGCDANGNIGLGQCTIDAATNSVTNCILLGAMDYYRFHNFTFDGASILIDGTSSDFWEFKQCIFQNATNYGIGNRILSGRFIQCKFLSNGVAALDDTSPNGLVFLVCLFAHNGRGCDTRYAPIFLGCVFRDNTNNGIDPVSMAPNSVIAHCVFDGNGGDNAEIDEALCFANRFTNSSGGYGLVSNDKTYFEDFCVYYNNALGARNGIISGINSRDASSVAEQGYTDVSNNDFNLTSDAIVGSSGLLIDW